MSNKKKQNIFTKIILPILLLLGGVLVGYTIAKFFRSGDETVGVPLIWKIGVIALSPLVIFVVIALHEIGHVLAGLWVGFDFHFITVGPFMIEKEVGKLKFKWNTNLNTAGGLVLCLPRSKEGILSKFMVFAIGGPFMSLVLVIVAYILASLFSVQEGEANVGVFLMDGFLNMTWLLSLAIFLVTIIPMQAGGFYTDGGRFLNLWKGGLQAQLEVVLLQTTTELFAGRRPSTIDESLLKEALEYPVDSPFKTYLHSFLYFHYLDIYKLELAEAHLSEYERHLSEIPSGYQAVVWLEKAFFYAIYKEDAQIARESLNKAQIGAVIPKATVLRAEAAVAFAEAQTDLAGQKANDALTALPKSIDKGTAKLEKDLLNNLLAALSSPL